jgi:anaerobic ribonucleoside-triphosphate reductase activating protein
MYLQINKFLSRTRVEGPGKRFCIWVQGCPIKCDDCSVPETWPLNKGKKININQLLDRILSINDIEGVTISGGEPFFQANVLSEFCRILKDETELSIVIFTGYYLEEIISADVSEWNDLLLLTDILIDGPYLNDQKSNKNLWTGSSNQRVHFLTDKYIHLKHKKFGYNRKIEFIIHNNGEISINGILDKDNLKLFKKFFLLKKNY